MRAHLYRPITDSLGNVRQGAVVRVLKPGTEIAVIDPIYASDTGVEPLSNPFTTSSGVVDIYLDEPQRVRLGIRIGSGAEFFINDMDVILPTVLYAGLQADGPPTNGAVFWYVRDAICAPAEGI